jgi:hypothetical protein
MKKETKQAAVFYLTFISALLSVLALIGFSGAQAYIRWTTNQNFTFLGESGLLSLAVVATGLLVALSYLYRQER